MDFFASIRKMEMDRQMTYVQDYIYHTGRSCPFFLLKEKSSFFSPSLCFSLSLSPSSLFLTAQLGSLKKL